MRTPRTTIRRKLILAIMLTSTTALALAGTALTIHEVTSLRALLARELATRAAILAANSTAALAFQNPEDASQVLAGLRTDPSRSGSSPRPRRRCWIARTTPSARAP